MIPILFESNATTFNTFGICALGETTSCIVTEERNGGYELALQYPTNGKFYNQLTVGRIIKAKPNETSTDQAFRIYRITIPINGIVTIYAQHISYDLSNIDVMPFSLTNVNPGAVMAYLLANTVIPNNFSFTTDYTTVNDLVSETPASVRSILGGNDISILELWGGEYEWDNLVIKHRSSRGQDRGVLIEYGKNLTKFDHDNQITNIYSDLLPYAFNTDSEGNKVIVTLTEKTIAVTTSLTTRKVISKDFSEYFEDGVTITESMLRDTANAYILENPFGTETPSISVSFEPLWKMPEYSRLLENISLCDTVTIRHSLLGITAKAKVVKTEYNCLIEKYKSITVGSVKSTFVDRVGTIQSTTNETKSNMDMLPEMVAAAIKDATETITGNKGGYVVFKKDALTGKPTELLVMDNEDIAEATDVWRWNNSGLGFSPNGYNGPYTTAITADGKIVADFITTGSLTANVITAGTIKSSDESSYWNIETGELSINGSITTESGTIGGFTIDNNSMGSGTFGTENSVLVCTGSTGAKSIGGSDVISGWAFTAGTSFGVTKDGNLYANSAHIQGDIAISSGSIDLGNGNFVVNNNGELSTQGSISADAISVDNMTVKNASVSNNLDVNNLNVKSINVDGIVLKKDGNQVTVSETLYFRMVHSVVESINKVYFSFGIYSYNSSNVLTPVKEATTITCSVIYYARGRTLTRNVSILLPAGSSYATGETTINGADIMYSEPGYSPTQKTYTTVTGNNGIASCGHFIPGSDDAYDLGMVGTRNFRWNDIYATNTTIQTSDKRCKDNIDYDLTKYKKLFDLLRPVSYTFKDGKSGRTHLGFISQDIEQSLKDCNIESKDFACFVKTLKDKDIAKPTDDDYIYGLRYGELHALEVMEIQRLNKLVESLTKRINELENKEVANG